LTGEVGLPVAAGWANKFVSQMQLALDGTIVTDSNRLNCRFHRWIFREENPETETGDRP
jgi:hypothetical protein